MTSLKKSSCQINVSIPDVFDLKSLSIKKNCIPLYGYKIN